MAYGMKFSPDGIDFFTSTWVPFNYVDSFELPADSGSGSKVYSLAPGRTLKAYAHNLSSGVVKAAYTVSTSGTTLTWTMHSSVSAVRIIVIGGV